MGALAPVHARPISVVGSSIVAFIAVLFAGAAPPLAPALASPTSSAELLVAQGEASEGAGDELTALRRYGDALALDPTSERAYLALGALRRRRGELGEAEEVYTVAMARAPHTGALRALVARGATRRQLGKLTLAGADLTRAAGGLAGPPSEEELPALRELIALRREQREPAAELAAWRRLRALTRGPRADATEATEAAESTEAALQVRVLGAFVGDVDPARRGERGGRGAGGAVPDVEGVGPGVRRSIASMTRRRW